MKLITFFMCVFTIQVSASLYAQTKKFDLTLKEISVKEVLRNIESQSNFRFFYNAELTDLKRIVSIDVQGQTIEMLLMRLFHDTKTTYRVLEDDLIVISPVDLMQQQRKITGIITDASTGEPLPGVNILIEGTTVGVVSDASGRFTINIETPIAVLVISYIGYLTERVPIDGKTEIEVALSPDIQQLDELIVVGYGVQKKSDITGSVASLNQERLEKIPNVNLAQTIQGSIAGVTIQTTSAGASPSLDIMIRGRNSIKASNSPLIVVDGIPYGGNISDLNPNDIKALEVLKDASSAAIYGSRGSNGVILITTKTGISDKTTINYDGYYSVQKFTKLPNIMTGGQFYDFKQTRWPGAMTLSEEAVYQGGKEKWMDWVDVGLRKGHSQQHNLSASGSIKNTTFYISGGITDVQGLAVNDDYQRLTSRINVDTKFASWLTLGTRTQLTYEDKSGVSPNMENLFWMNPLTSSLDENNKYLIYPWPEDPFFEHPLAPTLYKNINEAYQILTNNYAIIDVPFIKGLSYRINSGIRFRFSDKATYRGRNTKVGYEAGGTSDTERARFNNNVIENIISYNREFGVHKIFFTGVYSYENEKFTTESVSASGFPNDFLTWYATGQATLVVPDYSFNETTLVSQMLRLNYSYDSRYLLTLTGRRDGYSGFGSKSKWGLFPSIALGWNISNEKFFPAKEVFNELKMRLSYGLNGNQAVGAYESISRMSEHNIVSNGVTLPGYIPSVLGQDKLGWESSKTLNVGIDFGVLNNRINGQLNYYSTKTTDLLLSRSISPIHGATSITQNIGSTQNDGFEVSLISRNLVMNNFKWSTSGNISFNKNKILSLYGLLDNEGKEIDDIANAWFIGKPIRVNYDWAWDGVWQQDEADKAAVYGSKPGYVKLRDLNGDGKLTGEDRVIIGQRDPKFLWGLTNTFSYRNLSLEIFMHGVHGMTLHNNLMTDADTYTLARRSTTFKNWWTPENPTNEWVANAPEAERMGGITGTYYEDASFIRIKDISLSYDFSKGKIGKLALTRLRVYVTAHNLFTFTKWSGLDPELSTQLSTPLQKEYVFGVNISL